MKQQYEAPRVTTIGTVADLTQGHTEGDFLDANFPIGFPVSDVTVS